MAKFSEARALIECAVATMGDDHIGAFTVALERAQQDLRAVYNELDLMELHHGAWKDEEEEEEEEEEDER